MVRYGSHEWGDIKIISQDIFTYRCHVDIICKASDILAEKLKIPDANTVKASLRTIEFYPIVVFGHVTGENGERRWRISETDSGFYLNIKFILAVSFIGNFLL